MDNSTLLMMPGDTLMKEGDPSDSVYFLKEGSLNVFVNRSKVGQIKPGEFVGEMAFIDESPRSATVIAASEAELVQISKASFEAAIKDNPLWLQQFIKNLIKRIRSSNEL